MTLVLKRKTEWNSKTLPTFFKHLHSKQEVNKTIFCVWIFYWLQIEIPHLILLLAVYCWALNIFWKIFVIRMQLLMWYLLIWFVYSVLFLLNFWPSSWIFKCSIIPYARNVALSILSICYSKNWKMFIYACNKTVMNNNCST